MADYQIRKIEESEYRTSAWSGGTTTELFLSPKEGSYAERNFLWRLSSATVDLPESTFTALPGYERIIMTLEGELDLSHNGGEWLHLKEFMPHRFDGGDDTVSRGKVTDFNLMLKKGCCMGDMIPFFMESGESAETGKDVCSKLSDGLREQILYCRKGQMIVRTGAGETIKLKDGQALWASGDFTGEKWIFQAESSVKAVLVLVKERMKTGGQARWETN